MSDQVVIITWNAKGETKVEVRKGHEPPTIDVPAVQPDALPGPSKRTREWINASASWVGNVIKTILR